jgi:hypothetical protein
MQRKCQLLFFLQSVAASSRLTGHADFQPQPGYSVKPGAGATFARSISMIGVAFRR